MAMRPTGPGNLGPKVGNGAMIAPQKGQSSSSPGQGIGLGKDKSVKVGGASWGKPVSSTDARPKKFRFKPSTERTV